MNHIYFENMYFKPLKANQNYAEILSFAALNPNPYDKYLVKLNDRKILLSEVNQNLELKIAEFNSNEWEIWEPDYEMNDKLDVVRDKIEDDIDVDSRFYDIGKMSIWEIFDYAVNNNYFSEEELADFILKKK